MGEARIRLRAMTADEYRALIDVLVPEYGQMHVRSGDWPTEGSLERAWNEFNGLVPLGLGTPDHHFHKIVDVTTGSVVGDLWWALRKPHPGDLYIYWIGIDPSFRRHGYAHAALDELENEARRVGARALTLHVFGENRGARALYERAGFVPAHLILTKPVTRSPGFSSLT